MEILPMRPLLGFGRAAEIQPQGDVEVDLLRRAVGVDNGGDGFGGGDEVTELRFDDDGDDDEGEDADDDDNNSGSDFSFEFSSSMCVDLSAGGGQETMLTADELFFNGKLRPLAMADSVVWPDWYNGGGEESGGRDAKGLWVEEGSMLETETATRKVGRSLDDSTAMAMAAAAAAAGRASRRLSSLHENPRCVSMTVEGSRRATHRSCVSLNSSRCSSPSRSRMMVATASAAKEPRTTPSSPKAGAAAAAISASATLKKKSGSGGGRLLDFFKLRKGHHSHNSGKESLRSFWPFSRSNSAGESKSGAAATPLPRRSNSAGENKTTSSLLLPASAARKNNGDAAAKGGPAAGFALSSTDSPPLDNVGEKLRDLQLPKDSAKHTSSAAGDSYAIMPELQMEQWFSSSSSSSSWLQKSGPITAAEHRKAQGMVVSRDHQSSVGAAGRRGVMSSSSSSNRGGGGAMMVGRRRRDGSGGGGGSGSMRANCNPPVLLNVATPSSNSKLFFHLGHLLFSSNAASAGASSNKRDEKLPIGT